MVPAMETQQIWTAFCRAKVIVIGIALLDSDFNSRPTLVRARGYLLLIVAFDSKGEFSSAIALKVAAER